MEILQRAQNAHLSIHLNYFNLRLAAQTADAEVQRDGGKQG